MKTGLMFAIVAVVLAGCDPIVTVSPEGEVKTLAAAVEKVRALRAAGLSADKTVTIELEDGVYRVEEPLKLDARDSHLVVRAKRRGGAVFTGAAKLDWHPLADPLAKSLVPAAAQGRVLEAEIPGTDALPGFRGGGGSHARRDLCECPIQLFQDGRRLESARWPDDGFTKTGRTYGGKMNPIGGVPVPHGGQFEYDDVGRLKVWAKEPDLWAFGYWHFLWADVRCKVLSVKPEIREMTVDNCQDTYGYVKGADFYVFNAYSALDRAGEWVVDRPHRRIFAIPLAGAAEPPQMARAKEFVAASNVVDVTFRDLAVEYLGETAFAFAQSRGARVLSTVVRHIGQWAVRIDGGSDGRVEGCDFSDLGEGGVFLKGGDHDTLTPGNHAAENNHIHHLGRITPGYRPGVELQGVGNRAAHNLIHHGRHQGIAFDGNDHYIGYNVLHDLCQYNSDAGVIYGYMLDWTRRGTVIEDNVIFMIGNQPLGDGCVGVYLDAYTSGVTIRDNIFNRMACGIFVNGGQGNAAYGNVIANTDCAYSRGCLGKTVAGMKHVWGKGRESVLYKPILEKLDLYTNALWRTKYPDMLDFMKIEDAELAHESLFCVATNNVEIFGGKMDMMNWDVTGPYSILTNNVSWTNDPGFVDYYGFDWRVKPGSPLDRKLGPNRFAEMGLCDSPLRVSPAVKFSSDATPPRPFEGEYGMGREWIQLKIDKCTEKDFALGAFATNVTGCCRLAHDCHGYYVEADRANPLPWKEWKTCSFGFTPLRDCRISFEVGGGMCEMTLYDDFRVTGAVLKDASFEEGTPWREVDTRWNPPVGRHTRPYGVVDALPQDRVEGVLKPFDGRRMACCNGNRHLAQAIEVKKGVPVTVTFKARAYVRNTKYSE